MSGHLHDPLRIWLSLRGAETMTEPEEMAFCAAEEEILSRPVTSAMQAVSVLEVAQSSLETGGRSDELDIAALRGVSTWLAQFVRADLVAIGGERDPVVTWLRAAA